MRETKAGRSRPTQVLLLSATAVGVFVATAQPVLAGDDDDDPSGWSESISNSIKNTFQGVGNKLGMDRPAPPPGAESPSGCPAITILPGTESQRVSAAGATGNTSVRYQYSLANVGRQCTVYSNQIAIRVGADGRVLLGPAGNAGRFDIPIRVVVYSDLEQKPVQSKLYKVSASIPAGQAGAPFEFVSDNLVVPLTGGRSGADYSIKVGFDAGNGGADAGGAKVAHHRRSKAVASQ